MSARGHVQEGTHQPPAAGGCRPDRPDQAAHQMEEQGLGVVVGVVGGGDDAVVEPVRPPPWNQS